MNTEMNTEIPACLASRTYSIRSSKFHERNERVRMVQHAIDNDTWTDTSAWSDTDTYCDLSPLAPPFYPNTESHNDTCMTQAGMDASREEHIPTIQLPAAGTEQYKDFIFDTIVDLMAENCCLRAQLNNSEEASITSRSFNSPTLRARELISKWETWGDMYFQPEVKQEISNEEEDVNYEDYDQREDYELEDEDYHPEYEPEPYTAEEEFEKYLWG